LALTSVEFENIAQLTKLSRKDIGMTQLELSEKLGYSNGQFVSNLERGVCGLPRKKMKIYCKALKVKRVDMVRVILEDCEARLWRDLK